jgi:hypothetical protein
MNNCFIVAVEGRVVYKFAISKFGTKVMEFFCLCNVNINLMLRRWKIPLTLISHTQQDANTQD